MYDIVYRDECVLVLDKPTGLLAVPGRGPDLQDCLSARVQRDFPTALVVHRLDRDTSGLMVMALDADAQRELSRQFAARAVEKRYVAERFIRLFENRLCVYSESVSQLYTNYGLHFPTEIGRKMVVLPNPYAFHDTLHHISPLSVRKTGLCVLPGQFQDHKGLLLARLGSNGEMLQARPFKSALAQIISKLKQSGDVFLPVLVKGDLREFDQRMPYLHLHRLQLVNLPHLSAFERNDLQQTVTRKLLMLYRQADQLTC
jgi:hypothetical protein